MRAKDPHEIVESTEALAKAIVDGVAELLDGARGTCVSFTPKMIVDANLADGARVSGVVLAAIRYALDRLNRAYLLYKWKVSRRTRYIMCIDSPLWRLLRDGGKEEAAKLIAHLI